MSGERPYYTLKEAARALGTKRRAVQEMVRAGTLRAFRADGEWRFRKRDIQGLKRIQALLAGNKALPSAPPMPTEPSPEVWEAFEAGEVIDFEAMAALDDEVEDLESDGELEPLGDSVFSEALFGKSMTLDALVDALEENPRAVSESLDADSINEIREIAKEISGVNAKVSAAQIAARRKSRKANPEPPKAKPVAAAPPAPAPAPAPAPVAVAPPRFDDAEDDDLDEGSPLVKVLFALVLIAGFAGVLYVQLDEGENAVELPEVIVAKLSRGDIEQVVTARGAVEAVRQLNATTGIRGEIAELYAKVGQKVTKGGTVATIKARYLEEDVQTARSDIEAKQLQLSEAKVSHENARSVIKKERNQILDEIARRIRAAEEKVGRARTRKATASKQVEQLADELRRVKALQHGSEPDVRVKKLESDLKYARLELSRAAGELSDAQKEVADSRKLQDINHPDHKTRLAPSEGNLKKAQLTIARIEKEITLARKKLAKAEGRLKEREITAPLTGIVEEVKVQVGDFVAANSVLVVISDRSKLRVVAQVDETDVRRIARGRPASVELEAMPDNALRGEVVRIATTGKKKTGSSVSYFPTDILLLAEDGTPVEGLRPGLSALVEIAVESARKVLVVPIEAVRKRSRGKKEVVLAVVEGEKPGELVVKEVVVETGMSDSRHVELRFHGKLRAGAKIVVGPYRQLERLREGDRVKVVDPGTGSK